MSTIGQKRDIRPVSFDLASCNIHLFNSRFIGICNPSILPVSASQSNSSSSRGDFDGSANAHTNYKRCGKVIHSDAGSN